MDHLFSALVMSRPKCRRTSSRTQSSLNRQYLSCGDIPDLYDVSKKRPQKCVLFGSRHSPRAPCSPSGSKCMSNSELVNVVDAQLMQIKAKLAEFREQDNEFRERMGLLSDSFSELASQSSLNSFTPSECSDLSWLDEASEEQEEFVQQAVCAGQTTFSNEPHLCIPTVRVTGCGDHLNQPLVRCFHMRRAVSDPTLIHSHVELLEEEAAQGNSTYSEDQTINLYPEYNNPASTLRYPWNYHVTAV